MMLNEVMVEDVTVNESMVNDMPVKEMNRDAEPTR